MQKMFDPEERLKQTVLSNSPGRNQGKAADSESEKTGEAEVARPMSGLREETTSQFV